MVRNINSFINNLFYGYNPQEFLPIYENTILKNRADFVIYKAKRAAKHAEKALYYTLIALVYPLELMYRFYYR